MPTTNHRVRVAFEEGRIIRRRSSDPAAGELEGGEVWFREDTGEWRCYDGSGFVVFEEGRIIRRRSSDPAAGELEGGEVWFREDTGEWRGYDGSGFVTFNATAD